MIRAIRATRRSGSLTWISVIGTITHPSPKRSRLRSQSAAQSGSVDGYVWEVVREIEPRLRKLEKAACCATIWMRMAAIEP